MTSNRWNDEHRGTNDHRLGALITQADDARDLRDLAWNLGARGRKMDRYDIAVENANRNLRARLAELAPPAPRRPIHSRGKQRPAA